MCQEKPKVIVICGPTGIGKTEFATRLAETFETEIVSADSMQVYQYMDIGTAKPTASILARVPHSLIDVVKPDEPFDAGAFSELASQEIKRLHNLKKPVFLVGGTGLYIRALLHGLFRIKPANSDVLQALVSEAQEKGMMALYKKLQQIDPSHAAKVHPHDRFRILRALEIYEATGIPMSLHQHAHGFKATPYQILKIGLNMDRSRLYQRIDDRVDEMIAEGLLDEVHKLMEMGYACRLKAMRSLGYRHMCDFIAGSTAWNETIRLMKRDTRRYAKRQLTWFRKDKDIKWVDPTNQDAREAAEKKILEFVSDD